MEDAESRFLHLLQPIHDLTRNWEVDVAAQLGEYLQELEQICISFDGGRTTMNFIEAALLIQGSACIYSKKVEYLYSLVYQTLDFISNKRREKQPSSIGQDGKDADANFEPEEEEPFLSLDDLRDTSQASVDMRRDQQCQTVDIVPLTPMALVPAEEAEKRNNPLFSRKGELLASRKDFRMNTCTPHASGAFMLELAGLSPTRFPQEQHCHGDHGSAAAPQLPAVGGENEAGGLSPCEGPVPVLDFSADGGADDDDGACPEDVPMVPEEAEAAPAAPERVQLQRCAPQPRGYGLRARDPAQEPGAHIQELLDPWQSLDPFGDSEDKPFKKGRPLAVPRGLDEVPGSKRRRTAPRKLQDFGKWFSASYSNAAEGSRARRAGPTFADLELLYWQQLKQRFAAQRRLQHRKAPLQREPPLGAEEPLDPLEEECGADDDEDAADAFEEPEELEPPAPEELVEGALGPRAPDSLSYEELVRRNVELFMASSQRYAQETLLSGLIRKWEEKTAPLLQEQDERAAFDIHSSGDELVAALGAPGSWRSFRSLVAGRAPYDVCRCMLAALQLANDYTVEVAPEPPLAMDTMRLRLLTRERAHERFRSAPVPAAGTAPPQ